MHEFSNKKEMIPYRYGQIETPFLKKNQNEDYGMGTDVKIASVWRIWSFISLIVSFLLLLILMLHMMTPHRHVMYAEVLQNGFVKSSGWLTTTKS